MKRSLLCFFLFSAMLLPASAQVTRLSNNTSYDWGFALTNTKIILRSASTLSLWVYDIPGNSFTLLNINVFVEEDYQYGVMGGKLYFAGRTTGEGIELWVTDGTPGGTVMVKDINTTAPAADSEPRYGFIEYNGELYFTANDGSTGRELWKTNGTGPGTVRVKDINLGMPDAFLTDPVSNFNVINGVLVFSAATVADGDELWKSDGTETGTTQLKNIFTDPGVGSHISTFTVFGSNLIFTAFDPTNGDAIWKTDGTVPGTVMVKDVNPNPPPAIPPPFFFVFTSVLPSFFSFQNELYFTGDDGTNGYELWKTNGTDPGTVLVKDIEPFGDGFPLVALSVSNGSKFFFSATNGTDGTELWESDGTGPGTQLFKNIAPGSDNSDPLILPDFFGNGLFQGNKFFFIANTPAEGTEFYISDGTPAGTQILKDINLGTADAYDGVNLSWFYTTNKLFFVADNGANGAELWQSDGTGPGTTLLADVNQLPVTDGSAIRFTTLASNILFFFATDGDDPSNTDFFRIDGTVGSLPLRWISFEAKPVNSDVQLLWKTASEENTDYFIIQRSDNGANYYDIGLVNAVGTGGNQYLFTDIAAMKKAGVKKWYYRIKCIDIDTKASISRVVTVKVDKNVTQVQVLPNPVVNELKLVINATGNGNAVVRVMNMEGKLVLQRQVNVNRGENVITTDATHLPNGVYILQVTNEGSSATGRFLIQR
ncbi:MAG TPA: T9SS type A sorting domain-containing protein [Chitinophagaceae bacterium]